MFNNTVDKLGVVLQDCGRLPLAVVSHSRQLFSALLSGFGTLPCLVGQHYVNVRSLTHC